MDFYPAPLPISPAGYMCQPSPPQSTAVPPNMYPTLLPPAPHELAIRKIPPTCTLISPNPYPASAMAIVHLPANLMQALQREPLKYNRDDMVSTCSSCGQTNTLWDLRVKKMAEDLAEDYALKRYLLREIRFEPFPGEEPPPPPPSHSVANNIGYPPAAQPTDLCKISNLRANANEFTPAQKNYKNSQMQQTGNNAFNAEDCDYHQSAGRLGVTESSNNESAAQDTAVIDLGNPDANNAVDSIPEKYPQNDCMIGSSHGGSSDSVNARTDSSNSTRRKKNIRNTTRREARSNEPEMKMDSNRNYKSSDDMNAPPKKDKTNDTRLIYSSDHQRPSSRNADNKKGVPLNGKPNGLPRSSFPMKSRSYERRGGGDYNAVDGYAGGGGGVPSKTWTKSSNGGVPRKSNRRTSDLSMSMIHEIEGDLFTASPECSLAHCVAEDFRMGAGIAVQFKKLFGHVGDLLNQRKTVGEVAYLENEGRYIFYLITRKFYNYKPTLENMSRALKSLRRHCEELNVKKLAMPAISCGVDKLRWEDVKQQLYEEFLPTDVEIFVYHFKEDEGQTSAEASPISGGGGGGAGGSGGGKLPKLKCVEVPYPLTKIDRSTALVVYGAADGKVDKANESLNEFFPFLEEFDKKCKTSPKEVFYPFFVRGEYVCVLMTRNAITDPFDFARLESSIRKFNSFLKSNQYRYVGIERIEDPFDALVNDKIVNVFRSCLVTTVELYVCSSPPKIYSSSMSPSAPKYSNFSNVNSTSSSN